MDRTGLIAGYAAVVATVVFLWDIYKWKRTGPRISFTASPDMQIYGDPTREGKMYISVRAANIRDKSTTITTLGLRWYKNWLYRLRRKPDVSAVISSPGFSGRQLPYVLQPGNIWDGLAIQEGVMKERPKKGILIFELYSSHKKNPKRVRVVLDR